ncbi:MAG: sigma-70 family RNA polymerase sigma factor, partial [Candidatus Marinimicrobia bacterium]|nr:sigma-70 family RNA polymerase sigma factor [Candidatus Neomarinimicrobiota bacterium]
MSKFELTDEQLIKKFQDGDVGAYNQIVYRYKDRLLNFIYRFLNDLDRSEDLVQDTLLKLYTHKDSYKEIAKFSTWLYTIAANLARTELRKIKRRKTFSVTELSHDDREFIIKSTDRGPGEEIFSQNFEKNVQRALAELPDDFKTIIILRDIQELSYDEISKIVEVPLGTV